VHFIDILLGVLNVVIVILTLFLIAIILIQRGKGGGLVGAFSGAGGSSAFGTKTGDVFTKITVVVAVIWIVLSMLMVILTNRRNASAWGDEPSRSVTRELDPATGKLKAKSTPADAADKALVPDVPTGIPETQIPTDLPALPEIPAPK
jgi:preprotein translocase subunit SecG